MSMSSGYVDSPHHDAQLVQVLTRTLVHRTRNPARDQFPSLVRLPERLRRENLQLLVCQWVGTTTQRSFKLAKGSALQRGWADFGDKHLHQQAVQECPVRDFLRYCGRCCGNLGWTNPNFPMSGFCDDSRVWGGTAGWFRWCLLAAGRGVGGGCFVDGGSNLASTRGFNYLIGLCPQIFHLLKIEMGKWLLECLDICVRVIPLNLCHWTVTITIYSDIALVEP